MNLRQLIRESLNSIYQENQTAYIRRALNDSRLLKLFNEQLSENEVAVHSSIEKTQDVVQAIEQDDWDNSNPAAFRAALNKSKHKEMLTDYSEEELAQMKLFKLRGFDIGFALKEKDGKHQEIVAVFNNEPDVRGIGKKLVHAAIKHGGRYLDHFDGYLSDLYQSLGFDEYKRDKFDPQYDPDGSFQNKYGKADVIYRKLAQAA